LRKQPGRFRKEALQGHLEAPTPVHPLQAPLERLVEPRQCKRKAEKTEGKSGRKQFKEEDMKAVKSHMCSKVLDESICVLYPIKTVLRDISSVVFYLIHDLMWQSKAKTKKSYDKK
jgi:hypothetical protein